VAVEKAVADAISAARVAGLSWPDVGRVLGVDENVMDKAALIDAIAASRRAVFKHLLRGTS
jgi:hypothetical protein